MHKTMLSLTSDKLLFLLALTVGMPPEFTYAADTIYATSHQNPELVRSSRKTGECLPSGPDYSHFYCFSTSRVRSSSPSRGHINAWDCGDRNYYCADWAQRGECEVNPDFMLVECRYSCRVCFDGNAGITQLAPAKRAKEVIKRWRETQSYLERLVKQTDTRKFSVSCWNHHENCTAWATIGECKRNPKYMTSQCAAACRSCDLQHYAPADSVPLSIAIVIMLVLMVVVKRIKKPSNTVLTKPIINADTLSTGK